MVEAKIPPITVFFFVLVPTLALAAGVAVVASPEPRSWSFFTAIVTTWIGLRGSSWFIYKNRDDVLKLEKFARANESSEGLLVDNEEEKADEEEEEEGSELPKAVVYHHVHLYKILQGLMRPTLFTIQMQHASVASLIIVLSIRMLHIRVFGTHPANLDYGAEDNVAFVHKFDSFSNVAQGSASAFFSFPAVVGVIARVFTTAVGDSLLLKKPNVYFIWICETIAACMTIFPSATILIAISRDYGSFSNSNHLRKLTEWLTGYVLGISGGMYFSCIVQRVIFLISGILMALENHNASAEETIAYVIDKLIVSKVTNSNKERAENETIVTYGFGKSYEYGNQVIRLVEFLARWTTTLCQVLFAVSTFLTSVILGTTWYYDREEKLSIALICILPSVVIFTFVTIAFAVNKLY